mmetsp:Transcript_97503/g.271338  ORF Transcript_97503/g.271338 Transcript_97503/m.271338 type:complete len:141 (+) Transcript_97503:120-542(+)
MMMRFFFFFLEEAQSTVKNKHSIFIFIFIHPSIHPSSISYEVRIYRYIMSSELSSLQQQFDAAAEKARHISGLSNETKKQIYGLFKQATEGPLLSLNDARPRPGIFDPTGRAKWDSWKALGEDMSKEEAMKQYIALIDSL